MSRRLERFKEAGLIGCLNNTEDNMEWISARDRLPKRGEFVYLRYHDEITIVKRSWLGNYWKCKSGLRLYFVNTEDYWKPLPQPPKE